MLPFTCADFEEYVLPTAETQVAPATLGGWQRRGRCREVFLVLDLLEASVVVRVGRVSFHVYQGGKMFLMELVSSADVFEVLPYHFCWVDGVSYDTTGFDGVWDLLYNLQVGEMFVYDKIEI